MTGGLPFDFEQMMATRLGKQEYRLLAEALAQTAPTSIRLNRAKAHETELPMLNDPERVPWCEEGFYLKERPSFTADPLFHAGCYYVQEASSMFLSHVLKQYVHEPVTALDLCAAPGGKSTLMLSALPEGSLLVSNEVVRQRANILAENMTKWGMPNCIVTNNEAKDFGAFTSAFDLILCDVPCSGEGMFRKDPASIDEWSLANVEACLKRQRDIVQDIWPTLKEGGLLIYSTCTYNSKEDEENVAWIAETLGAEVLSCHPMPEWNLTETDTHFFPHRTRGEGFFISVMRKTADGEPQTSSTKTRRKEKERKKANTKVPPELERWLDDGLEWVIDEHDGTFRAFPSYGINLLRTAERTLKVLHAGVELATTKGKNLQPMQSLAMSIYLRKDSFPTHEADAQQAIAYLRTEPLQLPTGTPTGYVLLTYQGHPLGFVKNIGNRANNLYPAEWRIRKDIMN